MELLLALAIAAAPPQSCQRALGPLDDGRSAEELPNQVDGASIAGPAGLAALREARGEALIVVNGGDFADADLRGARLFNICFVGTRLSGSDWRGVDSPGIGFVGADLEGARLARANLRHVLLRNANLKDVDGQGASLVGGRLDGGWFDGSVENLRLDEADLSGFTFDCGITVADGCPVYRGGPPLSLRGADLSRANLWGYALLDGARIDRTSARLDDLWSLRSARLEGPILLRGGEAVVPLSPEEYRSLLPHLVDPAAADEGALEPVQPPAGPPEWARTGRHFLFVDGERPLAPSVRSHPLYRRLLPLIVGSSSSRVAVRFNADGSLDAGGEAVGANAHMCSLAGEALRFDPANGFYSGPHPASDDVPEPWRGRPMAVLMIVGETARVHVPGHFPAVGAEEEDPRFSDYASCGARAGFGALRLVPVTDREARRLLETLGDIGL